MNSDRICRPAIGDKDEAIRNLGGMVWLYEKHLLKFKNTYADSAAVTRDFLIKGNSDDARILIHSVKGLAGTLGLRYLYYAASDLEQAIKHPDNSIDTYLSIYESCLNAVLNEPEKD